MIIWTFIALTTDMFNKFDSMNMNVKLNRKII